MYINYCPLQNRIMPPAMFALKPGYIFKIYTTDLEAFKISTFPELRPCFMKAHYVHSDFHIAIEKYLASSCTFNNTSELLTSY